MAEILVERPRIVDGYRRRGRAKTEDALPKFIGCRREAKEAGGFKRLNENLTPLRRYLEKQVGRPWIKVYAEISARLSVQSTVQQHVRDHLKDFVQLHPSEDVRRHPWSEELWFQPFYVNARDGLLKRTDSLAWAKALKRAAPTPEPIDTVVLDEANGLRRIGGLWFAVELERLPDPVYRAVIRKVQVEFGKPARDLVVRQLVTPAAYDAATGKAVLAGPELDEPKAWIQYRKAHPSRWYGVAKRQLSRAELRRHRLHNSVKD